MWGFLINACFAANGCARSESTVVFYLQKLEDAKRNYGTLNFCDTFYYGMNPSTLLAYDEDHLKMSLKSMYETNKSAHRVPDIAYVEMNSYAVKVTTNSSIIARFFGRFSS